MKTISQLFQTSKEPSINFQGNIVSQIFERKLCRKTRIKIHRIKYNHSYIQGLRIKSEGAPIEINGGKFQEIILWANTSPEEVDIFIDAKSDTFLKMWNVWDIDGITQAWIGNAGMLITEQDEKILLSCSNGIGDPDFSALVIEIEFHYLPPKPC